MFTYLLQEPGWTRWDRWSLASTVGLLSAICVFRVLGFLTSREGKGPRLPPLPSQAKASVSHDPFQGGSFGETRAALRRYGNPIAVVIRDVGTNGEPYYGWVLNRSLTGLCLAVEQHVPLRTVLSVRATNAPETSPWVQVGVNRCQQNEHSFELGCEFCKTPS